MNLMITEVQIACIALMSMLVLLLAFVLPRYSEAGRVFERARKLLIVGTVLIVLHFILQYILHKQVANVADTRPFINLVLGFPITFTVNMSFVYLQRRGAIRVREWIAIPLTYALALIALVCFLLGDRTAEKVHQTQVVMATLYGITLVFCGLLQLRNHFRIMYLIRQEGKDFYIPLVRWMKWSMFVMLVISFGFPFMALNTNLLMRSLYGILSITAGFFYIFSFIGYGLSCKPRTELSKLIRTVSVFDPGNSDVKPETETAPGVQTHHQEDVAPERNTDFDDNEEGDDDSLQQLDEAKLRRIDFAVNKFIQDGIYLRSGITLKDAAALMNISRRLLRIWLKNTDYDKFTNWIVSLRIEQAKQMILQNPHMNSKEIADYCGFCDRQYYQHQFRKLVGITPAQWAMVHQKTKEKKATVGSSEDGNKTQTNKK